MVVITSKNERLLSVGIISFFKKDGNVVAEIEDEIFLN